MPTDDINLLPEDLRAKERRELERVQKTPKVIPVPLSSPSGQAKTAPLKAPQESLLSRLFRRPAAPKPAVTTPPPTPAPQAGPAFKPRPEIIKPQIAEVRPVGLAPAGSSVVSGGPAMTAPPGPVVPKALYGAPPGPVVTKALYGAPPEPERAQVLKAIRELAPMPAGAPKPHWWQVHWHTFRFPTLAFLWPFRRRPKMPKVKVMPTRPLAAPPPSPVVPKALYGVPPPSPVVPKALYGAPPPSPVVPKALYGAPPPLAVKKEAPASSQKPAVAPPPSKPPKVWRGLGINLLPEEFGARPELELPRKFLTIGVSVFSALLVVVLLYLWLTSIQLKIAKETRELEGQLTVINHKIDGYEDKRKEAINLQQLLRYVQELLTNHTYWTAFFQKLERHTLPEVYYTGFSMSGTDQLALQAVGHDYTSAAKQLVAFENAADFIQSVTISSVAAKLVPDSSQIAETNFTITLKLKPDVFLKAPNAP